MCGISVLVDRSGRAIPKATIEAINGPIVHRGPDDAGYFFGPGLALGHRRLAIIDLSDGGHQPMTWRDRLTITYNGEVYNYVELRDELEASGYAFSSRSDTEVILAAYDHWGDDCVSHFIGMWAFALYDAGRRRIFCSRDRFGVKPFVYAHVGGLFAAASEAKQLVALPGFARRLNDEVAFRFLAAAELNVDEQTFLEGVSELRGGWNLVYDLTSHRVEVRRWYDVSRIQVDPTIAWEDALEKFRSLFLDAVKLRLRSDVDVGACLSGGLDSSSIVVAARVAAGAELRLTTLSCCWDDPDHDESGYVRLVSEATGIPGLHVYPSSDELLDQGTLDRIVWHQDQPILGASHFAEYKIFEAAAQAGLKVMLDGQGGDECLAGYPEFFVAHLGRLVRGGDVGGAFGELRARAALRGEPLGHSLQALARTVLQSPVSRAKRRLLRQSVWPSWLNRDLCENLSPTVSRIAGDFFRGSAAELSKQQIIQTSIPYQLHSEDRNSMLHSVESRLPFLDYRVVELLQSFPDEFKLRNGETKAVLRHALEPLLPPGIRHRHHKLGFSAPEEPWISKNASFIRGHLAACTREWPKLFTPALLGHFDAWTAGAHRYDPGFFRALAFSRWAHLFEVTPR